MSHETTATKCRFRYRRVMLVLPVAPVSLGLSGCAADPPPIMVGAVPGDGRAVVTWLPPVASPAPIVGYIVTPYINLVAQTPTTFLSTATIQVVTGLTNGTTYTFAVKAINSTVGDFHSCVLLANGSVECWGENEFGQVGNGTTTDSSTSVPVTLP